MYLEELIFLIALVIIIALYRNYKGQNVRKFITSQVQNVYDKFAPYSFKVVREKTKELGQEYTPRQYMIQVVVMGAFAGVVSYLYFYNLFVSLIYMIVVVMFIPYLSYLRCKEYTVNLFLNKFRYIPLILLWNLQRLNLLLKH